MPLPPPTETWQWWVTYPPGMHRRLTNYHYTREQAEAKFGPGWCEPEPSSRHLAYPAHERRPEGGFASTPKL